MTYRPKIGQRNVGLHVEENRADIRVLDGYLKRIDRGGQWAAIWMDWLEIDGPFYENERAFFETLLHPEPPPARQADDGWTDENARELIERFAFEAFRRKTPADGICRPPGGVVSGAIAQAGNRFDQAMGEVLGVVLASPQFLFIQEAGAYLSLVVFSERRRRSCAERKTTATTGRSRTGDSTCLTFCGAARRMPSYTAAQKRAR